MIHTGVTKHDIAGVKCWGLRRLGSNTFTMVPPSIIFYLMWIQLCWVEPRRRTAGTPMSVERSGSSPSFCPFWDGKKTASTCRTGWLDNLSPFLQFFPHALAQQLLGTLTWQITNQMTWVYNFSTWPVLSLQLEWYWWLLDGHQSCITSTSPRSLLSKRLFSYMLLMLAVCAKAAAPLSHSMLYWSKHAEAHAPWVHWCSSWQICAASSIHSDLSVIESA